MERMNLENTTFFAEIRVRTSFFAKKQDWPQYFDRVFLFNRTKTLTQNKIEEIKHKSQRKHKTRVTRIDKARNFRSNEQKRK